MSAAEILSALDRIHGTVSVIGSMNADYTVTAQRLPGPGETITGGPLQLLPGGKSGNQAAAAARIGATVQMFGAVGKTWLAHNLGVDADKIYSISAKRASTPRTCAACSARPAPPSSPWTRTARTPSCTRPAPTRR